MRQKIIDAMSTAASFTTGFFDCGRCDVFSVQLVWTGDTAGTFKLQASNDGVNGDDISGASVVAAGSAASSTLNSSAPEGYKYVRVVYTRTSGSGVVTGRLVGKERGV